MYFSSYRVFCRMLELIALIRTNWAILFSLTSPACKQQQPDVSIIVCPWLSSDLCTVAIFLYRALCRMNRRITEWFGLEMTLRSSLRTSPVSVWTHHPLPYHYSPWWRAALHIRWAFQIHTSKPLSAMLNTVSSAPFGARVFNLSSSHIPLLACQELSWSSLFPVTLLQLCSISELWISKAPFYVECTDNKISKT